MYVVSGLCRTFVAVVGSGVSPTEERQAMGSAVLRDAIGAIRDESMKGRSSNGSVNGNTNGGSAFGSLVFGDAEQQKRLPKSVYQALRKTMAGLEPLDPSIADAVAKA